ARWLSIVVRLPVTTEAPSTSLQILNASRPPVGSDGTVRTSLVGSNGPARTSSGLELIDIGFAKEATAFLRVGRDRRGIAYVLSGLDRPHSVSLPAISRHLRVLEAAGLLKEEPDGRVRRCQIDAAPLSAAFGWLTRYRVLWEDRLARLAEHLEETRKKERKEERKHAHNR